MWKITVEVDLLATGEKNPHREIDWESRRHEDYAARYEDMGEMARREGDGESVKRYLMYAKREHRLAGRKSAKKDSRRS